jgi:hypothetical protein
MKGFLVTHNIIKTKAHIFFTAQKSRYNENDEIVLGHIGDGAGKWKEK